jgi:tetratricopeptide (TPR) repeat protein
MKTRHIFSLAMVFVLAGCATYTPPRAYAPPRVDYFQRGVDHLNNGEYDLAIQDFTEAIRRNQNNAAAYGNRGLAYRMKGEYDLAIRDYTEVIRLDPKNAKAYGDRGLAYLKKGKYDLAIRDYTKVIRLDPKNAKAYGNRGLAYLKKGKYDLAIRDLTKAIRLDPKDVDSYGNRGLAYDDKGEYDLAIRDYTEVIRLDPDHAAAYGDRGLAYLKKGEYDLAIRDYTEVIRLDPKDVVAYANRGIAYRMKGEYDLVIRDFTKVIHLDTKNVVAYGNRGLTYLKKGEYDLAIHDFNEAIRLDPKWAGAYSNRGFYYFKRGEDNKAEADWRKAAELNSDTRDKADSLENISLVYLKQEKWKTALAHTASVNALRDDLAWNWLLRAIAAHQMGDHASASSAYGKWSTLRKADDARELAEYLPKCLHVYLNELPTTIMTTRTIPTLVSWRAPRKTRILSVGVGNFKDTAIPKIDYAESDARGFACLAKSSGIPEENISHLTNKDAYRNDITDALIKLKMATTEKSETAIFYFSGHGAPLIKNGKIIDAALVPYNAAENSLEYTGIKISMLQDMLSDTRGNWIVILDACFSGKEGRSLMAQNVKGIAVVPKKFNIVHRAKKSLWWVTATSGDNFANDFPKENHGLFTYYFLKALNGEKGVDANEDGLISMKEAFDWTSKEVRAVSAKSLGRLQVPELIGEGDTILTIPR